MEGGTGLRTVLVGVNLVLVLLTTAIVGSISLQTGDTLLQDSRDTGEDHVSRSLAASNADLQVLGGLYLTRVLDGVQKEVRQFLDRPVTAMRQISQFILQHDADTITDPDWFANVLHPVLYSKMAPLIDGGTTQLYVGVVPFSPSYPNATNARGGEVAYAKVD